MYLLFYDQKHNTLRMLVLFGIGHTFSSCFFAYDDAVRHNPNLTPHEYNCNIFKKPCLTFVANIIINQEKK